MKSLFTTLPRNLIDYFKGRMILWHAMAILLTLVLVTSRMDWLYFCSTRDPALRAWVIPAAALRGLVLIVLPLVLLAVGRLGGWPG